MKYYKVVKNYNGDFVSIDETELEKAIYAFLTNLKVVFKKGIARGQDILDIKPDFNKALGYNADYKIQPNDYSDVNNLRNKFENYYLEINNKVKYLIESKQENLIGKNIEIPKIENTVEKKFIQEKKQLVNKFKI